MSQDEARFPMVPTLTATLGVKGHRPVVGTWDCKHLLYVFAVVDLASAAVHANLIDSPKDATAKTGKSKTRRLQEAFAAHLRTVPLDPEGARQRRHHGEAGLVLAQQDQLILFGPLFNSAISSRAFACLSGLPRRWR